MKKLIKEDWFKAGVLVALFLFAIPPAYYFLVYAPNMSSTGAVSSGNMLPSGTIIKDSLGKEYVMGPDGVLLAPNATTVTAPVVSSNIARILAKGTTVSASAATASIQTNSAPCEQIATEAAQSEQSSSNSKGYPHTTTVSDAYYATYTGEVYDCFYELVTNYDTGSVATAIHYAPNDDLLAKCFESFPGSVPICSDYSGSTINQTTFQLTEAKLFSTP